MKITIRETRSVCPVCLENLPAVLTRRDNGQIWLEKTCNISQMAVIPMDLNSVVRERKIKQPANIPDITQS